LRRLKWFQRMYASDNTWNHFQCMYNVSRQLLPIRKQLQRLARRYEKVAQKFRSHFVIFHFATDWLYCREDFIEQLVEEALDD